MTVSEEKRSQKVFQYTVKPVLDLTEEYISLANSQGSDKPAHLFTLARAFAARIRIPNLYNYSVQITELVIFENGKIYNIICNLLLIFQIMIPDSL